MHILAQLIGHSAGSACAGRLRCALLAWGIALLHGCAPAPAPSPPEPLQESVSESVSEEDSEADSEPDPGLGPIAGHPLAEWNFADDFEDFHDIWATRFALSVAPHPDPGALLPYADAVLSDGNSWGLVPEEIQVVFFDQENRACRLTGPTHPGENDPRERSYLSEAELTALGWESLQATATIREDFTGTRVQVLGALRARASCLACHTREPESLLAVLVYGFNEIPDD